jgi:hypothetical protein
MPDLSLMAFAFDLIVALWLPLPPIRRNLCITESALIISPSDGRRRSPKGRGRRPEPKAEAPRTRCTTHRSRSTRSEKGKKW